MDESPPTGTGTGAGTGLAGAVGAVLVRPWLWGTALTQAGRLAAPGWWRRWPPLPVPDADYLRFRMQTQYGDPGHRPDPSDLVAYLKWCRGFRRVAR
ncbi:MAG TPA: hypothetical protein VFO65_11040 [Acidimicrobiales bacterium]|nr:hypothetical protein [Acidimicrobiales bacterium]